MLLREICAVRQLDFHQAGFDAGESGSDRVHRSLPREARTNACLKLWIKRGKAHRGAFLDHGLA